MEAKLVDDTVHGSFAYREVALSEFLGNDFRAGFRIKEAVADDLADEFLGASIVGFGPPLGAEEALPTLSKEERPELEVALTAETKLDSGAVDAC